jgi:hypothetical protein
MHILASHYRRDFHRALRLPLVTNFDDVIPDGARPSPGRDTNVVPLELAPQLACRFRSSPSALGSEPPSVAPTRDNALRSPELPIEDTVVSTIRHWHDCRRRVFTI